MSSPLDEDFAMLDEEELTPSTATAGTQTQPLSVMTALQGSDRQIEGQQLAQGTVRKSVGTQTKGNHTCDASTQMEVFLQGGDSVWTTDLNWSSKHRPNDA